MDYNANPDVAMETSATPLLIASQNGHFEVVKLLLEYNANPQIEYVSGATSLLVAVKNQHKNIIKILLEYGANIYARYNKMSIFEHAKFTFNNDIINLFNQEVELREAIESLIPFCSASDAKKHLEVYADEVYTAIKCKDDSKPIYKYIDQDSLSIFHKVYFTMICEYHDMPPLHDEL